jgi:hypothetical protein
MLNRRFTAGGSGTLFFAPASSELLASARRNEASLVESSAGFAVLSGFSGIGVVSAKVVARAANSDEQQRFTV